MTLNALKCRWCGYQIPKNRLNNKGELVNPWRSLQSHIENKHPEVAEEMKEELV